MRAQENKTIQHLKDMGLPCSNTLQRGGSGIPKKSGYVTMHVAGDSFEGSCECEFCAQIAKSLKADSSDEDGMCESKKNYGPGWLVQAPAEEEASGTQKTTSEGKRLNDNQKATTQTKSRGSCEARPPQFLALRAFPDSEVSGATSDWTEPPARFQAGTTRVFGCASNLLLFSPTTQK